MNSAHAARTTRLAERFGVGHPGARPTPDEPHISRNPNQANSDLKSQSKAVRSMTDSLVARLSAEDQMVQSCANASPVKWHQAYTT
jgi:hypothetical protein